MELAKRAFGLDKLVRKYGPFGQCKGVNIFLIFISGRDSTIPYAQAG